MLMNHYKTKIVATCGISLTMASNVYAGRPMVVDDATLVSERAYQLETWYQKHADANQFWMVPACNVGGNLELAVGLGSMDDDNGHNQYASFQAKTLIKPLDINSWGIGFSVGSQMHLKQPSKLDWNLNVPVSISLNDDDLLLHANIGWNKEAVTALNSTTWGIAAEKTIFEPLVLTAEVYGSDRIQPFYQFGFKYKLYKELIQFDMSYADQLSSKKDNFYSIGFVLMTDQIFSRNK